MRQLMIAVPRGCGVEVSAIAERRGGTNIARFEAEGVDGPIDLVIAHVSNRDVGSLLDDLEAVPGANAAFAPRDVLTVRSSGEAIPEEVRDVGARSEPEIFLGGLQSVGSWRSFVAYAAAAGAVVWVGLTSNTVSLLVAAMLIAPFASPAMNAALASARGAAGLLARSLVRYVVGIAVGALTCMMLTLVFRVRIATPLMTTVGSLASNAVLLPLVAGAAGALHLVQSDRKSLVSGAATGVLIAASLAPAAGLVGIGAAIERFDLVLRGAFLIALQIAAINLSGALVFRLYGISARRSQLPHGRPWVVPCALAASAVAVALLVAWQLRTAVSLQGTTIVERARASIGDVVTHDAGTDLVDATIRFPRSEQGDERTLLCVVYVQRARGEQRPDDVLRRLLADAIRERLRAERPHVVPLVDVRVVDADN